MLADNFGASQKAGQPGKPAQPGGPPLQELFTVGQLVRCSILALHDKDSSNGATAVASFMTHASSAHSHRPTSDHGRRGLPMLVSRNLLSIRALSFRKTMIVFIKISSCHGLLY